MELTNYTHRTNKTEAVKDTTIKEELTHIFVTSPTIFKEKGSLKRFCEKHGYNYGYARQVIGGLRPKKRRNLSHRSGREMGVHGRYKWTVFLLGDLGKCLPERGVNWRGFVLPSVTFQAYWNNKGEPWSCKVWPKEATWSEDLRLELQKYWPLSQVNVFMGNLQINRDWLEVPFPIPVLGLQRGVYYYSEDIKIVVDLSHPERPEVRVRMSCFNRRIKSIEKDSVLLRKDLGKFKRKYGSVLIELNEKMESVIEANKLKSEIKVKTRVGMVDIFGSSNLSCSFTIRHFGSNNLSSSFTIPQILKCISP